MKYSENTKQLIYQFPVVSVLSLMGRNTDHFGYMYYSPFNAERTPSCHIDVAENRWYDHSEGVGGGPVKLASLLLNVTMDKAMDWIAGQLGNEAVDLGRELLPVPDSQDGSSTVIDSIDLHIRRKSLVQYGKSRGIPYNILDANCVQVNYHPSKDPDRHYFSLGFCTNSGGYALRNSVCKSSTRNISASTLGVDGRLTGKPTSDRVMVFEGFFDYLSWLALMNRECPKACDVVVLNSVSHLRKALPFILQHRTVACSLDGDAKGVESMQRIMAAAADCEHGVDVEDKSSVYTRGGFKDLNEFWMNRNGLKKEESAERKRKRTVSVKP